MMRLYLLLAVVSASLTACTSVPSSREPQWSSGIDHERLIVVTLRNDRPTLVPRAGSTARSYSGPARYSVGTTTLAQSRSIAATYKLREVTGWPIGLLGIHCLVYELADGADRGATIERLQRDKRVDSVQPLHSFETLTGPQTNPYRGLQRNLDLLNVSKAHRWSRGEGVRIGIVDSSVDVSHPDLEGRIAEYRDFVGASARDATHDTHGTAVAGLIGASDQNAVGIVGIAPAARLYAYQACWSEPSSGGARCNTLTLAKGLIAAIEAKAEVVNLSLGGPADPLLTRIVQRGLRRGIVFVGAASAQSDNRFPTSISGVIAVDTLRAPHAADAMLFAPGEDVLTLAPNGTYDFFSGSSLAAATISGGIALLLARQPGLTVERIRSLLLRSTRHAISSGTNADGETVDLCFAVASLTADASCN